MTQHLIIGAGAVGTVLAAALLQQKQAAALWARPSLQGATRLRVTTVQGQTHDFPAPPLQDHFDGISHVWVCSKTEAVAEVIATFPEKPSFQVLSALNGMAALRQLQAVLPHTQPATILFNSQLVAPLTAHITTHAEVLLPEPMLFKGSFIRAKTGSEALHWGKLLINLGNAIGAVYQATFKDLLTLPPLRTALADTLEEAMQVLDAAGIVWELPLAVPARVYVWALRHGGPLPWWVAQAKNGLGEGAYPSMVADVRAGRPTEVAWLNGEIVRLAAALGRDAPVNRGWVERLTALNPATAAR